MVILAFTVPTMVLPAEVKIKASKSTHELDKLIFRAVDHDNLDEIQAALDQGASINVVLRIAAHEGKQNIIKFALRQSGADINSKNSDGNTALNLAALNGHYDIVTLLLDNGAHINTRDLEKRTPLINATRRGHAQIVELLLQRGANPFLRTKYRSNALELAQSLYDDHEGFPEEQAQYQKIIKLLESYKRKSVSRASKTEALEKLHKERP